MSLQILSIKTTHTSFSNFSQLSKLRESNTLGAICFVDSTAGDSITLNNDMPTIQLHTPILDGLDTACEVWALSTSNTPVTGSFGSIKYRINDEFLFGVITLPESLLLKNKTDVPELQLITESAYRQIFALMDKIDHPHIYRFWNYMADINGVSHGLERYRQFNIGRKNAFLTSSNTTNSQLPAACALGTANGPLSIAFLLGRKAPVAIENPRQVSAYEYPEDYGPKTPSFSRATLLRLEHSAILFISGTASIVGHQTLHTTDVVAQTRETLANLEAVIAEANNTMGKVEFNLRNVFLRVYIRHAADLSLVRNEIHRHVGDATKAVFIQADICRQELLLEIEATAESVSTPANLEPQS
jgi:chorismate lyase/3-hydroxybenzoate synthase